VLDHRELMRLHVETLFTMDGAGRLVAVNVPSGAPAPRFFMGRTRLGTVWSRRHDLATEVVAELESLVATMPPSLDVEDPLEPAVSAPFTDLLATGSPLDIWAGPAYCFPPSRESADLAVRVTLENRAMLERYLPAWLPEVADGVPMTAVVEHGAAVALCSSVRIGARAHEAGVETHPDFRGRGFAAPVVAAWADAVRELDRIPLYSTSWGNAASRAVARKLGLIQYGSDLEIH
jgi:RimJ/RimL family protein N-acetyltransferase